jgi:hypothetical protein
MTLNVTALGRVADWLERGAPHHEARGMRFDMGPQIYVVKNDTMTTQNWCGTACCIAGAVVTFETPDLVARMIDNGQSYPMKDDGLEAMSVGIWGSAQDLLGIDDKTACKLFAPFDYDESLEENAISGIDFKAWPMSSGIITPKWAAATIRKLIATGEVRWDLTNTLAEDNLAKLEEVA